MKGRGRAGGAVSIVNAISTGFGAALGIDLQTEAELETTDEPHIKLSINGEDADPSLAKAVIKVFSLALDVNVNGAVIRTYSNIPVAVGLKSSSSAAVAIANAFLDALGEKMSADEMLRNVAEASILSGTSITGALDDAAACMLGGIVATDNHGRKILKHVLIEEKLYAVIYVPPGKTYTASFRKELLTPIRNIAAAAFTLALEGKHWEAMTINGLAHSAALGLPIEPAVNALRAGACAAGLSGTGPAVAAIVAEEWVDNVADVFSAYEGKIVKTSVNRGRTVDICPC
ncbi:shikimate kinase [Candidatus Caldarchaeum subterraneum]|uniref:Shikimate kinase n=1 Tax=Caldiarchaeum subterraneum TaxID=311458 RepID=E6N6H8_CALS0|nr:shikimate kinase [Candidatus Caldarchaeum subterraneum]BAJ47962.1 shikimate kinase [Candidatus Caldarchaeum subterraneum]BAJ49517.1 shikimate kinase [Candidatus Caldarchaeum subterraneum]BAJ50756.1 shikimate kinase [Candidatus Caldarchaeum subterraneum]